MLSARLSYFYYLVLNIILLYVISPPEAQNILIYVFYKYIDIYTERETNITNILIFNTVNTMKGKLFN